MHHQQAEYIITTLVSQQHRKDVKFMWAGVQLSPDFPGLKLTSMPMLESLRLFMSAERLPLRANISLARSSRLRRFSVQKLDFDLETGDQPLSLSESGDIRFSRPIRPGGEVLHIWLNFLKAAPNLKKFHSASISGALPPSYRPHSIPFIILPNLHTLIAESGAASYILDYVTLPRLRSLYFESDSDGESRHG